MPALLDALIEATEYEGDIGFLRGSGLSLWDLLGDHLWPVLVGLGRADGALAVEKPHPFRPRRGRRRCFQP